jgi:hypothetical protein
MPSALHHPALVRLLLVSALCTMAGAGESGAEKDMAIEVAKAGPDYQVQGEYLGTCAGKPLAAQVIAHGGGTFLAVFEPGGFPGDGWDGTTRIEVDGKSGDADKTSADFDKHDYKGKISAGSFTGTNPDKAAFTLKKVNRVSPTSGLKPPAGALVLFDGSNMEAWNTTKIEILDGEKVLAYNAETKKKFTSYQLHVEFREPFKPYGRGQDRGNSGIYIHHTYEIQVLDSFGLKPENNLCASLYTVIPPLVNAEYPPLSWQTYDIDWQGPGFDAAGVKTRNAALTVKLNGVLVQDKIEVKGGTGANKAKAETPAGGPLWLQDHHNPVYFRNIWLLEKP